MTFKISSQRGSAKDAKASRFSPGQSQWLFSAQATSSHQFLSRLWQVGATLILLNAGCQTGSVGLPPANLAEPGWTVRRGQAVWHLPQGGGEIAGEVMVALRPEGRTFVQFIKEPFPIVIGQASARRWEVEFPPENKRVSGGGTPPKRIIWLYLPSVLSGNRPPRHWTWKQDGSAWRLENPATREALEGYFDP
ncbi:MAG TPA: hypothetical protein VJA21_27675 [Verrucomicrobiae bacterium]